jgi:hypothetical protein
MAIISVTRWKGGARETVIELSRKAKAIHERNGAEICRLAQIHTGDHVGQWLFTVRYKDWEAYGKTVQALMANAEFQKLLAEVGKVSELVDRRVLNEVEL